MADPIDFANDLIDHKLSHALHKIRENVSQKTAGSKFCIECGDDIPLPRQELGFKLCKQCAQDKEKKEQLFAG